jgi:hypothetical protein
MKFRFRKQVSLPGKKKNAMKIDSAKVCGTRRKCIVTTFQKWFAKKNRSFQKIIQPIFNPQMQGKM